MLKKWDFSEFMSELKEAESVKEKKISPEELLKYTVDESVHPCPD